MSPRINLWKPEAKRRVNIVRPPVVPGLSLSKYSNNELGVRIARQSNAPQQEPGIAWARLMHASNRPEKDAARDAVLACMTLERFPVHFKVLTFPASEWRFERALLTQRNEPEEKGTRITQIYALERDIAVFRAACHNIPRGGSRGKKRQLVRSLEPPAFATAHIQTAKINGFLCCTFEDYAMADEGEGMPVLDAAWLDFNGNLTPSRLDAIARFWTRQLRSVLVVTLSTGRTSDRVTSLIRNAGGIERLLAERLSGSVVEDVRYYGDGAPMVQVVLRRGQGMPQLLAQRVAE